MDLVLYEGQSTEVWHNRGAAWLCPPSCSCPTVTGVAVWSNGDGDGDVDLGGK